MNIETWNLYFPEEEYTIYNDSIQIINNVKEHLKNELSDNDRLEIDKNKIFELSLEKFYKLIPKEQIDTNAENALKCVSCAISDVLFLYGITPSLITTRITSFQNESSLGHIETSNLGKIVFVLGTVCRIGFKKLLITKAFFECNKCGTIIQTNISNNVYKQPNRCKGNCKSKTFNFIHNHPEMICKDLQEIKVQEVYIPGDVDNTETSGVPKTIDCHVYDEFVGTLAPGDVIQAVGILGVEAESDILYKLTVKINNINLIKNKELFVHDLECQEKDFLEFKEIAKTENIVSSLIHSLYPNIFGNELIKTGLLLSLFGGTKKYVGQSIVRPEIHVLIIGDPGLGKSRMLLNTCSILPKSAYVSGNFTTTAGLTVSITHDPVSGEFMADAGALVVADKGVCCLDEFDKIDDHTSLFEAMEDQKVTVAKGGVICSVPTRTTIIAASNPKHGHFDQSKSVFQNIKFDSALLSRFDLVFVLLDNLTEEENYEISDQILKKRHIVSTPKVDVSKKNPFNKVVATLREDKFINSLKRQEGTKIYSISSLRKYIAYSRSSIFPLLSKIAKETIKKYYLSIRTRVGVTTRDLESIIRITEARAKIEMRSIATKEDASFAIEFYKKVLLDGQDKTKTKKKLGVKDFVDHLKEYVRKECKDIVSKQELCNIIAEFNLDKPANEVIEALNFQGLIIKRGADTYKII